MKLHLHYIIFAFFALALQADLWAVSVKLSASAFSPNHDASSDTIRIQIKTTRKERKEKITDWKLEIKNRGNTTVKSFSAVKRKKLNGFFARLFSKDSQFTQPVIRFPKKFIWDGFDDSGQKVQDGEYKVYFSWSINSSESTVESVPLELDTQYPVIKTQTSRTLVTPDGDRLNDELVIRQQTSGTTLWQGRITNQKNKIIQKFDWSGKEPPLYFKWDALDSSKHPVADGKYQYTITGKDLAGNIRKKVIHLTVKNNTDALDITSDSRIFAPGENRSLVFKPYYQGKHRIKTWFLYIFRGNPKNKKIYKIFSGQRGLPEKLQWQGETDRTTVIPGGNYHYQLVLEHQNGFTESAIRTIRIHKKELNYKFKIKDNYFSPDGDGKKDLLTIYSKVKTPGLKRWKLSIIEIYGRKRLYQKPVWHWEGEGNLQGKLFWDGRKYHDEKIGSWARLKLQLEYTDRLGRSGKKTVAYFRSGILTMQESPETFRISIPENERNWWRLRKARNILKNYPGYTVELQYHTNQRGEDETNLLLSEQKARSLFFSVFARKRPFKRFLYRGCGEITALVNGTDEYAFDKNHRTDYYFFEP